MQLIEDLKKITRGEVMADDATLDTNSRDASLFEIKPKIVIAPRDVRDIKNIVNYVRENHQSNPELSITARSAGTDMTGGPLTSSLVLDMTNHFNAIKEVGADFAITEPGVYYRDFEKETLKHGLLLPCYPASRDICTVGGMAANNSGGEKTLAYGKTEDFVERLKVILSDGNEYIFEAQDEKGLEGKMSLQNEEGRIYREMFNLIDDNYNEIIQAKPKVSKNSAGYYLWNVYDKEKKIFDLTKLIVGSQGTLGIITEIKYRLIQPKPFSQMLVIFLKDLNPLSEIVNHLLQFKPESLETFDDNTFKVGMKFLPALMKKLSGNYLKLGLQFLPEFWMVVTGGIPKMIMLAEFTGETEQEAMQKATEAQKSLQQFKIKSRITRSATETEKYWTFRRESFNLLRQHVKGLRTAPFIDDFIVEPQYMPKFLPELNAILDQYKIIYTIAGHAGNGNFHIIPLMNLADPNAKIIIEELSAKVYNLVLSYHGSITAEHNDGLIRSPFLRLMYGEKVFQLFEQTKNIFDPLNIFNPGKKVNSTTKDSLSHLISHS